MKKKKIMIKICCDLSRRLKMSHQMCRFFSVTFLQYSNYQKSSKNNRNPSRDKKTRQALLYSLGESPQISGVDDTLMLKGDTNEC